MSKASEGWTTRALTRRSASLVSDGAYQKALAQIQSMQVSVGMKHLLAGYVTDLRLKGSKIPDKLLSRKKSKAFLESVETLIGEDRGLFEISGMISVICAVLVCMFVRAVMLGQYVLNFSVDALIAAAAFGFLILNLRSQWKTVRFYGPVRDYVLLDVLALLLWGGLLLLMPRFDTSLIVFLVTYFIEKFRFRQQMNAFLEENGILLSPESGSR